MAFYTGAVHIAKNIISDLALRDEAIDASPNWDQKMSETAVKYAVLAYSDKEEIEKAVPNQDFIWFEKVKGIDIDTQAFACKVYKDGEDDSTENRQFDVVVAFRGTQQIRDFITDLKFMKEPLMEFDGSSQIAVNVGGEDIGTWVHKGFNDALNAIWMHDSDAEEVSILSLSNYLKKMEDDKLCGRLWLTGHSLGGALATIAAARIELSKTAHFKGKIGGLVTIGSPRVLGQCAAYELIDKLTESKIFRIYKTFDPIPAVPRIRYKHVSGSRCVVSSNGKLVVGADKRDRIVSLIAAGLRTIEDFIGAAIPGQHKFSSLIADHDKHAYYEAVKAFDPNNRLPTMRNVWHAFWSLLKILGVGGAGYATGTATWASYGETIRSVLNMFVG